jgi:[acyl-carrier-protein] S-malonyltransferase
MGTLGLDAILEIGPGKVLSGFVRKTLPEMPVYAVETVADLEKLPEFLEQLGKERVS